MVFTGSSNIIFQALSIFSELPDVSMIRYYPIRDDYPAERKVLRECDIDIIETRGCLRTDSRLIIRNHSIHI